MHAISDDRPDAEAPHLPRRIRDDATLIVEHDTEAPIGKDLVDDAFDRKQFFLGQAPNPPKAGLSTE